MSEQTKEEVKEEGTFKMKKKKKPSMKKLNKKDNVTKVDLTKKQGDADTEPSAVVVPTEEPSGNIQTMEEGTSEPEVEQTETTNTEEEKVTPIIQEVTDTVEETTEPSTNPRTKTTKTTEVVEFSTEDEIKKLKEENEKLKTELAESPADAPVNTNKFSTNKPVLTTKQYKRLSRQERFLYNLNK